MYDVRCVMYDVCRVDSIAVTQLQSDCFAGSFALDGSNFLADLLVFVLKPDMFIGIVKTSFSNDWFRLKEN